MAKLLVNHAWPHPELTKIHEPGQEPTRHRVLQTIKEAAANATSVKQFTGGHPDFGCLGDIVSPADYQTITGQAWNPPPAPPAQPALPNNPTQFQIQNGMRQHTEQWAQYQLRRAVNNAIKTQILKAGDPFFFNELNPPIIGFANRSARNIVEHLETNYAPFDEDYRNSIKNSMVSPWNGGPFKAIITQIEQGVAEFAQNNHIINDNNKCLKLYNIVNNSGLLPLACEKWRLMDEAQKTWLHVSNTSPAMKPTIGSMPLLATRGFNLKRITMHTIKTCMQRHPTVHQHPIPPQLSRRQ